MPALKSDLYLTIRAGDKSFSIGAVRLPDGSLKIKRGRSWSNKLPTATLTQVFTEARKWAARNV